MENESPMLKIDHLEVRFEVEGDDDRKHFATMFKEMIGPWSRDFEQAKAQAMADMKDRKLDEGGGTS